MSCLISVIIPVYNVETYLRQCVDSILGQTYRDLEVILVDDGSPDGCPAICDNYALQDSRIKVIHKVNGGLSDARNVGLEAACGEYVMFVDSDDYWCKSTVVSELVSEFRINGQEWDFLIFNFKNYYQRTDKMVEGKLFPEFSYHWEKDEKIISLISCALFPISAWSKLIRRDFLIRNNIRFIKGITGEDTPWFFELLEKCRDFGCMNCFAYVYRRQVSSSITSMNSYSDRKFIISLNLLRSGIQKVKDSDDRIELKQAYFSYYAYFYFILLGRFRSISLQKRHETKKILKSYCWLVNYRLYPRVNKVAPLYRILGFTAMSYIFYYYMKKYKA